jgi:cell fate (sporulation/competence/biofilm development) regulator YlbF (YheA/YmcA/DUF963 family)
MATDSIDNLEIAPASVVKQAAHDFAAALTESQQFKTFEQVTFRFRQDEAAQKDMHAYKEKQQELRPLMRTGGFDLAALLLKVDVFWVVIAGVVLSVLLFI